ncbi:single-stranded-DNA-specific exonuclease RecJ [Reinekea thalattae]|uniref:Single-stranded-DNA-specific exonuclease RecJ n=1 Tax=Reinekea thalattae TaxID=2593301 RepID=A0A5C8ZCM1_9GAMM|nr:single-stranded-DNA-specific exonuclease RecJ [Reinekea thalattae]
MSVAGVKVQTRRQQAADQSVGEANSPTDHHARSVHPDPLLNRLYLARGIRHADELETSMQALLDWQSLKGIDQAVELLLAARQQQQRVMIVGDYDADGATSTALAMLGLSAMGLNVQYQLPNRFEYGYGLSPAIVELVLQQQPDLILTVDNGISSFDGIALAKQHGVKVLVTDHHLPADTLPNADAIVNPNQPGCAFASKAACGCTVMFYVLIALRAALREQGEQALPNLAQWLDLVALATIADVVPLDKNNRMLVSNGLQRIRQGRMRPGMKALFEVSGRDWQFASSEDFGFSLGPRLNAAGRLGDMSVGVQLLLTEQPAHAHQLATDLQNLNSERRQIEASMLHEVERIMGDLTENTAAYSQVVFGDSWHEGVIGILASRIKDRIYRPVVAFARDDNGELKGSARSIKGIHLRDCLDWLSKQQPELILKFGGHAMAAGLTIREADLAAFTQGFEQAVQQLAEAEALTQQLWVDGELGAQELNLANALTLEQAGPWGQSFPAPSFYGEFAVSDSRVLAGKHLKLTLVNGQNSLAAIAFNVPQEHLAQTVNQVRGVYQLSCNRFRGATTLQLVFSNIEID